MTRERFFSIPVHALRSIVPSTVEMPEPLGLVIFNRGASWRIHGFSLPARPMTRQRTEGVAVARVSLAPWALMAIRPLVVNAAAPTCLGGEGRTSVTGP